MSLAAETTLAASSALSAPSADCGRLNGIVTDREG